MTTNNTKGHGYFRKQNADAVALAEKQVTSDNAILEAYNKTKKASDTTNADAEAKFVNVKKTNSGN